MQTGFDVGLEGGRDRLVAEGGEGGEGGEMRGEVLEGRREERGPVVAGED